uniref:Peptidase A1 domain-containing protein n=1 Tax=Trichuris muris TaxID=70415 RepID=A0A5S6QGG9_TRIMR
MSVGEEGQLMETMGQQKLYDYASILTIGDISIGTPPQTFSMMMDTTSGDTWIPGRYCAYNGCGNMKEFDSFMSSTYSRTGLKVALRHGPGMIYGFTAVDNICIANLCSQKQQFMEGYQTSWYYWNLPYDGVVGLAFPASSQTYSKNVVINLAEKGLLEQPIFTIWKARQQLEIRRMKQFQKHRKGVESGLLTLGKQDILHCSASCLYVNTARDYWRFTVTRGYVPSKDSYKGNKTKTYYRKFNAIVSSSNLFILGPYYDIWNIATALGAWYNTAYAMYTVDCKSVQELPDVLITISGSDLPISADNYVIKTSTGLCLLAFQTMSPTSMLDWVLGEPWLQQYCHVHNVETGQLSFCTSLIGSALSRKVTSRIPLEVEILKNDSENGVTDNISSAQTTSCAVGRQSLYDCEDVATIGEIKVGIPLQKLKVVIDDTASSDLCLPGKLCNFYGCGKTTTYDSSASRTYSTTDKKVDIDYELEAIFGTMATDRVCIGTLCSKSQPLIQV